MATQQDAIKLAMAIGKVESGGNYNAKGGSGEYGAFQFMPSTWSSWSKQYLNQADAPMTKANQNKVASMKVYDLLNQGYSSKEVALIWNGGTPTVKKGVNKYGVAYDSGAYSNKVVSALNGIQNQPVPVKKPFNKKIDELRTNGKTDTDILNSLGSTSTNMKIKINMLRDKAKDSGRSDKEILNWLSTQISGKTPSVASVPVAQNKVYSETQDYPSPTYNEYAYGAGKGIISTFAGTSSLGERMLNGILKTVLPKSAEKALGLQEDMKQTSAEKLIPEELRTPKTDKEKIGFFAEQLAEFFIPGGSFAKAGKAAEATTLGTKLASRFPKISKVLGFGARAGVESGAFAGQTALQEGEINKEVKTAGLIGAAMPVGGLVFKGIGSIGKGVSKFVTSKLSGVPIAAMEHAIENPKAVSSGIKMAIGNQVERSNQIAQKAADAVKYLEKKNQANYAKVLSEAQAKTTEKASTQTILNSMEKTLNDFKGLTAKQGKNGNIIIDASQTTIRSHEKDLQELVNTVKMWKDTTPEGIDRLRQVIKNDFVKNVGSAERQGSTKLYNSLVNSLKEDAAKVLDTLSPELREARKQYASAADFYSKAKKELNINKFGKATTTTERKLLNVFNPKSDVYRDLVTELGDKAGKDMLSDIAGFTMSKFTPEGLSAYLTGAGVLTTGGALARGQFGLAGKFAAGLLLGSPRLVGESLTKYGIILKKPLTQAVINTIKASRFPFEALMREIINASDPEDVDTYEKKMIIKSKVQKALEEGQKELQKQTNSENTQQNIPEQNNDQQNALA